MLEGASSFLYKTMTQRERLLSLPDGEFIRYEEDELYGYKSSSGEILIPARFSHAPERASERMEVWSKGKCGYINKAAEEIMPIIYDDLIGYCYETHPDVEMYLAEKDGKFGLFDNDFNELIPMMYDDLALVHPVNPTPARLGDKWGYINCRNEVVVDFKFEDADIFIEDVAYVKIGNKYGYINIRGDIVIPPKFDDASAFHEGIAMVMQDDKEFYIDKMGNVIE